MCSISASRATDPGMAARKLRIAVPVTAVLFLALSVAALALYLPGSDGFFFQRALGFQVLPDGDFLVTDGGGADWSDRGSKVFIIDAGGRLRWLHEGDLHFAHSSIMLRNGNILVPDTNADRLVELDRSGATVWSSESWGGGTGRLSDGSRLDYPNYVEETAEGRFLVSSRYTSRVVETDRMGQVFWSYEGATKQHAPRRLANGNTLVADSSANRVVEVDRAGHVVWGYARGLDWPRFADRLANGDTLITDSNHNRVIEVTPGGEIVFEFGPGVLSAPYQAEGLSDGTILIADAQHGRLLKVDRSKRIVWKYERKRTPLVRWLALPAGLSNGGAEMAGSDGLVEGWIACDLTAPEDARWSRDSIVHAAGQASFRISAASGQGLNRWWGRYIRVMGRGSVSLSALVRTRGVSEGAGLSLNFIDARGGILGGANSPVVRGDSDWKQVAVVAPIPRGTALVGITLSLIGPGDAWWDEVGYTRN